MDSIYKILESLDQVKEGRNDEPMSACCDAPLLNYDDGLGICSDCKEWSGPHEDEVEEAMGDITPIDHSNDEDGASADDIASAITRRLMAHPKFGALVREIDIIDLNDAIEDIAQFHKGGDLGTSDVSNMVNDVLKQLGKPDALKEEDVEEGSFSRKFMKAMTFGPQTDSPKDMQDGIRKMSDKELLDLMRGDDVEAPSGSARSLQQKLLKRELRRRGIGESGVNEEEVEENAFNQAAAAAARAGKKEFEFGGKTHPVKMDKSTAHKLDDDINEDYDRDEYDEEGEMVKSQARTIEDAAKELQEILDDDENLPEWVQKKVTLAKEYIDTARDYMKANPDEEDGEENPEELDEEAVSRDQQEAAGAALSAKRGETPVSKLVGASKEMYNSMTEKELEDFAGTKHKGLPEKVKKKKTDETTVAGSVAPGGDATGSSIYGNPSIYESFNSKVENMISESMNVSVNSSNDPSAEPSITVSATGEDANMLAQLLQLAAVPRAQGTPCETCGQVHEGDCMREGEEANSANNTHTYDMQYLLNAISGGLNGQKRQINPNNPGDNPLAMTGIKNNTVNIEESEDVSASHLETLYREFKAK